MNRGEQSAQTPRRRRTPSEWYYGRRRTGGEKILTDNAPAARESAEGSRTESSISEEQYQASRRHGTCAACARERPWWYWVGELPQHLGHGGDRSFVMDWFVRIGWYRCPACFADYCGRCSSEFRQYVRLSRNASVDYAAEGKYVYRCPYCGGRDVRYTGYRFF